MYASAINWDYLGHLNITYRTSCDGHVHCVAVNSDHFGNYTCHENPGYVIAVNNGNGHFDSDTRIRLNDDCNNNWGDHGQKVITCQEEGHVYGDGHEFEAAKDETCMATPSDINYDIASWNATPRHHDFVELDDHIYDHND